MLQKSSRSVRWSSLLVQAVDLTSTFSLLSKKLTLVLFRKGVSTLEVKRPDCPSNARRAYDCIDGESSVKVSSDDLNDDKPGPRDRALSKPDSADERPPRLKVAWRANLT